LSIISIQQERRSRFRYPANHYNILIKLLNDDSGEWEKGSTSVIDLNRYGIGLETKLSFPIGETVTMLIDTFDSEVIEIAGLICNRSKSKNGFRLGVRFRSNTDNEDETSNTAIDVLEDLLIDEQRAAQHK